MISEEQFLKWMSGLVNNVSSNKEDDVESDLRAAFQVFDQDNNGYITRDELRSAMTMMGEVN